MTASGYIQLALYIVVLIALAKPLGAYMARVYEGQPAVLNRRSSLSSSSPTPTTADIRSTPRVCDLPSQPR